MKLVTNIHISQSGNRPTLFVNIEHEASGIYGVSWRDIPASGVDPTEDIPAQLILDVMGRRDVSDYDLIRVMKSEAINKLAQKARFIQADAAELDAITGTPLFEEAV